MQLGRIRETTIEETDIEMAQAAQVYIAALLAQLTAANLAINQLLHRQRPEHGKTRYVRKSVA